MIVSPVILLAHPTGQGFETSDRILEVIVLRPIGLPPDVGNGPDAHFDGQIDTRGHTLY
jgi:hypothetical protein